MPTAIRCNGQVHAGLTVDLSPHGFFGSIKDFHSNLANSLFASELGLKRLRRPSESWAVMQVESGLSLVNPESKPKVTANNIVPFARKAAAVA